MRNTQKLARLATRSFGTALKEVATQNFRVDLTDVTRDCAQNLTGNRMELNHPKVLQSYSLGNKLKLGYQEGDLVKFTTHEGGGAHPQVTAVYSGIDFTGVNRAKRDAAPDMTERPLWRGNNGWVLNKIHSAEQGHLISQLYDDVKFPDGSNNPDNSPLEIKGFDSQANEAEVRNSIAVVAEINKKNIEKGNVNNLVKYEYAIPVSEGGHHEPNPYTNEFFMSKVQQGINQFKANQDYIPADKFSIGFKDMVGELDDHNAPKLVEDAIELMKENGVKLKVKFHCHNTGKAVEAYAAVIEVCERHNWPVECDYVAGKEANFSLDADPSEVGTGFVDPISIHEKLIERNAGKANRLSNGILKPEQIELVKQKGTLTNEVLEEYKLIRAEVPPYFYDIIKETHLAGGAFSSFKKAALDDNAMAAKLNLSSEEALKVSAYALNVAGYLMGQPLSVTPAMQNRQIAALHLLNNMIQDNFFEGCVEADAMIEKLRQVSKNKENGECSLTDEQVQKYFLGNMDNNPAMKQVMTFLKDPVPGDFIAKEGKRGIHSVIVENLKEVPIAHPNNRIPEIKQRMEELWNQRLLGPDAFQVKRILQNHGIDGDKIDYITSLVAKKPEGMGAGDSFKIVENELSGNDRLTMIEADLKETTIDSATSNAIVAGLGVCIGHITHRWKGEPDAARFNGNKEAYERAMYKYRQGLDSNPKSDPAETIIHDLNTDLNISLASARLEEQKLLEQDSIYQTVNQFIEDNKHDIAAFVASSGAEKKNRLNNLSKQIYQEQSDIITNNLLDNGQKFFLNKEERIEVAFDRLSSFLAEVSSTQKDSIYEKMQLVKKEIEAKEMLSPMPGIVVDVSVKEGQEVKEGDEILIIEAMKMKNIIKARRDGVIDSVNIKAGASIAAGTKLIGFAGEQQNMQVNMTPLDVKVSDEQISAVMSVIDDTRKEFEHNRVIDMQHKMAANHDLQTELQAHQAHVSSHNSSGYNLTSNLSQIGKIEEVTGDNTIHIIGNRAGCASKIKGDLEGYGCKDVRLLYTSDDGQTPVVSSTPDNKKYRVGSYMDQDGIIKALESVRDANPGKTVVFHPGWGFLSEVSPFVEKCEARPGIVFAGPPSKPMELSGGKKSFRDQVQEASPELNPPYIGSATEFSVEEISRYVRNIGAAAGSPIDQKYRAEFAEIMKPDGMNGDAVIKAVAGGGGKGIAFFKNDPNKSEEENYAIYMKELYSNTEYAANHFSTPEMLVEKCIRGNSQHIEVQLACDGKGGIAILGLRNCMVQTAGQKFAEMNIIKGDYSEETMENVVESSKKLGGALSANGYKGVGTLEMMIDPQSNEVTSLEINTRIQVEHAVTEADAQQKTGKPLSIPVINTILTVGDVSVDEVLSNQFHFTAEDRKALESVSDERILHFRINAKSVDLEEGGKAKPTSFRDALWNSQISSHLAEKHGVSFIHGGKGGNYDSQIGAIWGDRESVNATARDLYQYLQVMERLDRSGNITNLDNIIPIYEAMLDNKGNFRHDVATDTVDRFMKEKEKGFAGDLVEFISGKQIANENKPNPIVSGSQVARVVDDLQRGGK